MSPVSPASSRAVQNTTLDQLASTHSSNSRRVPLSLRPGEQIVIAAAQGNGRACAIRDAWKPRFAVTLMTTAELAALSDRCSIIFAGSVAANA